MITLIDAFAIVACKPKQPKLTTKIFKSTQIDFINLYTSI